MKGEQKPRRFTKSFRIRPTGTKRNPPMKTENCVETPIFQINELDPGIEDEEINRFVGFDNLQTREEIVETKSDRNIGLDNPVTSYIQEEPENIQDKKSKIDWSKYEKKYKVAWERDPKLKGWMIPHSDNPGKVTCRYCNCVLRAHKTDLHKHSETKKHRKSLTCPNNFENEKNIVLAVSSSPKGYKRKFKTEEVVAPDGSYFVLESEAVLSPERDPTNIYMEYSDHDLLNVEHETRHSTDQEISGIASRIGVVLIEDIEQILKTQKNVLKFFKENEKISFSDSNLRKMAKICVGHLSQKYLVDSALEPERKSPNLSKDKTGISFKLNSIEEKIEHAVTELKNLKVQLDVSSDAYPYASVSLRDILSTPSTSRH